jgi:hypothetical protein
MIIQIKYSMYLMALYMMEILPRSRKATRVASLGNVVPKKRMRLRKEVQRREKTFQ